MHRLTKSRKDPRSQNLGTREEAEASRTDHATQEKKRKKPEKWRLKRWGSAASGSQNLEFTPAAANTAQLTPISV